MQGLSAGRVQSVATRLVVERERERMSVRRRRYWDVDADVRSRRRSSRASSSVDGTRVARAATSAATASSRGLRRCSSTSTRRAVADAFDGADFPVALVDAKPYTRRPAPPFMTSTLQQEASRKLRLSAQHTMRVAQRLYENGFITYMRTDRRPCRSRRSPRPATRRASIRRGVPARRSRAGTTARSRTPRRRTRPSAPPVIASARPTRSRELDATTALYELIWKRTIASQMTDASGQTVTVRIAGRRADGRRRRVRTAGTSSRSSAGGAPTWKTWTRATAKTRSERVPRWPKATRSTATSRAGGARDQAPARYTEASLVKELEERGSVVRRPMPRSWARS